MMIKKNEVYVNSDVNENMSSAVNSDINSDVNSEMNDNVNDDINDDMNSNEETQSGTYDDNGSEEYSDSFSDIKSDEKKNVLRERMNYVTYLSNLIKYNELSELESECNYKKFKKILATSMDFDDYKTERRSRISYANNEWFLSKIIVMMLKHCLTPHQAKKRSKYIVSGKMKALINTIILDYYDVVGKNRILINWLIKCKMWGIIDLINKRTPINSNDFSPAVITIKSVTELNKINIYMISDIKTLFRFNKSDFIIEYIKKNLTDITIQLTDTNYMSNISVVKFVCDNNLIPVTKKAIRYYHENHNLLLLNYLIETGSIRISIADIKSIFKPKTRIDIKKNANNAIRRLRVRRRMRRMRYTKNKKINDVKEDILGITKKENFTNNICKYMLTVQALGHKIQIQKNIKSVLFTNGIYGTLIELIKNDTTALNKSFDKYERMQLFEFCIADDNLTNMKILIDKKIIMINELHEKDQYLALSISKSARNITNYMLKDLKVKGVNLTANMIWSRYSIEKSNTKKLYDSLDLMKDLEILSDKYLEYIIHTARSSIIIDKIINNYGYELKKQDIIALKFCKINDFLKFTKNVNYNKKIFIGKLMRQNSLWNLNKNLAFDLFKTLPNKLKLAGEYGLRALEYGNESFFNNIIKHCGDKFYLEILNKKKVNTYSVDGFAFFGGLVKYSKDENIIDIIKNAYSVDEIEKLLMTGDKYTARTKKNRLLIQKLGLQLSTKFIRHFAFDDMNYYYKQNDENFFEQIIKANDGHKNDDMQYKKEIFDILISHPNHFDTLLKIHDNDHDYFKFMTKKIFYEMMIKCYNGLIFLQTFPILFEIFKSTKNIVLTPYIYTIIRYGHSSFGGRRWWNNNSDITFDQFYKLLQLKNQIMIDDYRKIIKLCKPTKGELKKIEKMNIEMIENYVPDNSEISDEIDRFIVFGKNREENPYFDPYNDPYNDYDSLCNETYNVAKEIDQALTDAINGNNDVNNDSNNTDNSEVDSIDSIDDSESGNQRDDIDNVDLDLDLEDDTGRIVDEIMLDIEKEHAMLNNQI